ncbi:MAG: ABC transporter permease subunit [Alphaproteobacteria bacterium]|nr:ABC transporter permease subunit [Alphaproteobacteria bacterium]
MILHVARREWLEVRRHPGILAICAALLALLGGITFVALVLLQLVVADPTNLQTLAILLGSPAAADAFVAGATQAALTAFDFLIFSQYLGFVGVMAGHSLLHDRQVGTLPFLLLAPVTRPVLLAGKVLGALAPLTAVHVVISAVGGLATVVLPVTAGFPELGPRSAGWWVALLLSGPAWGAFVATTCAVISSLARDVRMAQQAVWFVVFFVQLLVAFLITGSLGSIGTQVAAAVLGAIATGTALAVGANVLSRDLGR